MKYRELFDLNEITQVIQIDQANTADGARELVDRFVITSSLGTAIQDVALPQLDFASGVEGHTQGIVVNIPGESYRLTEKRQAGYVVAGLCRCRHNRSLPT